MPEIIEYPEVLVERFGMETLERSRKMFAPRKIGAIVIGDKACLMRPVSTSEVSMYSKLIAGDAGIDGAARYLINALWIDGDREIMDDEENLIAAMMQVQKHIELKKADFFAF